jgi:hypothetical protein
MHRRAAPMTGDTPGMDAFAMTSTLAALTARRSYIREAPTQAAALAERLAGERGDPDEGVSPDFWRRISTQLLRTIPQPPRRALSEDEIKVLQTNALADRLVDMLRDRGQVEIFKLWLPSPTEYDEVYNDIADLLHKELTRGLMAVAFVLHAEEFRRTEDALDIQYAVTYVRDVTFSIAHLLMLFPVGVELVQAADNHVTTLALAGVRVDMGWSSPADPFRRRVRRRVVHYLQERLLRQEVRARRRRLGIEASGDEDIESDAFPHRPDTTSTWTW